MKIEKDVTNLCVDLDRTLLSKDSTFLIIQYVLKNNRILLYSLLRSVRSWKLFKKLLIESIDLTEIEWDFNSNIINFIISAKKNGHKVHLVTASNKKVCKFISNRLELFDSIHHSGITLKLKGKRKAEYLNEYFGERNYMYIGDSLHDIFVWRYSIKGFCPRHKFFKFLIFLPFLNINPI